MMNLRFAAVAAALSFCAPLAHAQPVAPETYGALPNVADAEVSPDGKTLAAIQNVGAAAAVIFYDLSGAGAQPTGINVGETNAREIIWANNDIALLLVSQSERVPTASGLKSIEFFRWLSVSKSSGKAEVLFENEPGFYSPSPGEFMAVRDSDPGKAVFARHTSRAGFDDRNTAGSRLKKSSGSGYSLFEIDLAKGRVKRIEAGNENTQDWIVDSNGDPLLRIDYNIIDQKREVYKKTGSNFELLASFDEPKGGGSVISFHGLSSKPGVVLASTYGARDKRSLVEFDTQTGEIGATVFSNPDFDIDSIRYNRRTSQVEGVRYTADMPEYYHLSAADRSTQSALGKALPNAAPIIGSKSDDGTRMVIIANYRDHPRQYFLYDKTAKSLNMVAPSYNALDGRVIAAKEPFSYQSDDGLTINGYLTVPRGASRRAMPLIVLPHGGPEGRDDQAFYYWEFFYAARGYLVYQPNFRGSDGYGFNFRSAGYGEWGRKMQGDITNGVEKLVAAGMVDPDRICIVGASYGGYAALAGATLTPDLYACAVSVNGVSNLPRMLNEAAGLSGLAADYWEVRIGSRFRDAEALNAVSPAKIAAQAGAPILLIHSKDDIVVPYDQSLEMRNALQSAGKAFEFVTLDGEDHWLSSGKTRTEMLRESINFIDSHIGAGAN